MAAYLPQSMITEILSRLPVKSLLICKSVCKPWLHLITCSHFINSHLKRANPILLYILNPPSNHHNRPARDLGATFSDLALQMQRKQRLVDQALEEEEQQRLGVMCSVNSDRVVLPRVFYDVRLRVVSACNGIVCLDNGAGNVVCLWNPSIRQCKRLPAPNPGNGSVFLLDIGFGYDPVSDDYKVVRIVFEKMNHVVPTIQVYSAKPDSWKLFQAPVLKNFRFCMFSSIVVNGVLYFHDLDVLFSLDLNSEVLRSLPFPFPCSKMRSDLLDFKGSVALVFGDELWTLDYVPAQMSWTKRFSIEADSETQVRLSRYFGAGQFYGRKMLNRTIFLYNVLYDYEKKKTKFYGLGTRDMHGTPLKYTETLVSLDGFGHVE